jgi:hypothetical protein
VARIPDCAYELRALLVTVPFEMSQEDEVVVQRKLANRGYSIDDLRSAHATIIQSRLLKATTIVHHLEMWENKYKRFISRNYEQYKRILQAFDIISFKTARNLKQGNRVTAALGFSDVGSSAVKDWQTLDSSFQSKKSPSEHDLSSVLRGTAANILEDLRKELDFFIENALMFVSRAVLSSEVDFSNRRRVLRRMGFAIQDRPTSIVPALLFIMVIISISSWLWILTFGIATTGDIEIGKAKVLVLGGTNVLLNAILVQYSKNNFAFANQGMSGDRPWAFILTVGLVSAFFVAIVRAGFEYFQFGGEASGWSLIEKMYHSIPWSLNIWATGTAMALLSVDSFWDKIKSAWYRRALDGGVFGLFWVSVLLIVAALNSYFKVEGFPPVPLYTVIPITFGFGFVIGFSIIENMRYRLPGLEGVTIAAKV